MRRRSHHRLTTTLCMVLSLFFSQMALAGYTCPAQVDADAMADMAAAGAPCDGMDPAQPVLCHQHAAAATPAFDTAKLPAVGMPMLVQSLPLWTLPTALEPLALAGVAAPEARPPPAPLFLATLRFRV